jgi:hypothetical protein
MSINYRKLKSDLQKQGRYTLFVPHNKNLVCIGFGPKWSKSKIINALLTDKEVREEYKL